MSLQKSAGFRPMMRSASSRCPRRGISHAGLTANGRQPVIEAAAKLSSWLSSREAVAHVARHLGCTLEAAERQIVDAGRGGRIKARGVVADQPVSPSADWNGRVDLAGTTMKPPEVAYEITNPSCVILTSSRRICCRRQRRRRGGRRRRRSRIWLRAFRSRGMRGRGQAHRRPRLSRPRLILARRSSRGCQRGPVQPLRADAADTRR